MAPIHFFPRRAAHLAILATGIAGLILQPPAAFAARSKTKAEKKDAAVEPPLPEKPGPEWFFHQSHPPKSPEHFNPDPGGGTATPAAKPATPAPDTAPAVPNLSPDTQFLFPSAPIETFLPPERNLEPLPDDLKLPRRGVRSKKPIMKVWEYPEYPLGREGLGLWDNSKPVLSRWDISVPQWKRYMDPSHETPYQYETPKLWHPYRQSKLKGDVPIIGEDIFLNLTAKNFSIFEKRKLPVPSGVSAATPNSSEFFGRSEQTFFSNDFSVTLEMFQGETAFKPVDWAFRISAVYNNNWIRVKEANLVDPDPRGPDASESSKKPNTAKIQAYPTQGSGYNPDVKPGSFTSTVNPGDVFNYIAPQLKSAGDAKELTKVDTQTNEIPAGKKQKKGKDREKDFAGKRQTTRHKDFIALQELFFEYHLGDHSDNYDFWTSRIGIQPFVSDFRGFIFNDTNLGIRLFGNWDNNHWQYNLAFFDLLEKDTYSGLNTFERRQQQVLIANLYKQDFIVKGYTAQWSFHANFDQGGTHYDKNGFLTRPSVLGTITDESDNLTGREGYVRDHEVRAFYLGWAGDGHIGRLNLSHAMYYVFGEDSYNPFAGRKVDISAFMAAAEASYDRDWIRFKLSGFYASGDSNPDDRTASGFDSINDAPFFIGGPFSWYAHEGINLAGTAVNFKNGDSLLPNLRSSKFEAQSNFVNPGVGILGFGIDTDITPKLRGYFNANYIWLAETATIEKALHTNKVRSEFGLDLSLGFKYRPLLTDNIIVSAGAGFLLPGPGYKDIYRRNTAQLDDFGPQNQSGKVDDYLYNIFVGVTLLY